MFGGKNSDFLDIDNQFETEDTLLNTEKILSSASKMDEDIEVTSFCDKQEI